MKKSLTTIALALSLVALSPAAHASTAPSQRCTLRTYIVGRSAGMSHQYETVKFVNIGRTLCVVRGYPTLAGSVGGKSVALNVQHVSAPVRRINVAPGGAFAVDLYTLTAYNSAPEVVSLSINVHRHRYSAGELVATTPGSAYPVYESPARPLYSVAPQPPATHNVY